MSKVAIVYWSGPGNTEAMAKAIEQGVEKSGNQVNLFEVEQFKVTDIPAFDGIIFGCPAMGDEVLEETEFEPMFEACEAKLAGKRIVLFGSYGWGDGQWMQDWEERCRNHKAELVADSVICEEMPDDEGLEKCRALGKALAV